LFPFNPDRVLRDIQKAYTELVLPRADEVKVGSYLQDDVLQTPVTPVTVEALTSLCTLIEQDAHKLDETSKQRLQRRLQKFANAAHISFAERALLADENRLLFKQNNEAKVRGSTKPTVVGKAKVMSYKDIEEAREKRATKEAEAASKKRGRKRKSPAPVGVKAKKARRSKVEVAGDEISARGMGDYCSVLQQEDGSL
jgi:hypothetical protein